MKKIWDTIKKYMSFVASPITLFFIVGIGVIIGICGVIFGFGHVYDFFAKIWSAGALILILPFSLILLTYAWLINPIKWCIAWLKKKYKK